MEPSEILKHVDHTLLTAYASWEEVKKLCDEAIAYHTASVCVPPSYVKQIKETYDGKLVIDAVIGFPLGYSVLESKLAEVKQALIDGADELDMVINIGDVKNKKFDKVENEVSLMKESVGNKILKVIIETCYLTDDEKIKMCEIVTKAKADYIKTSTGFGSAGAKIEDIRLFKKYLGPSVKIKAAGGIKTKEDLEMFISEGCDRIGSSSAVKLLTGNSKEATGY